MCGFLGGVCWGVCRLRLLFGEFAEIKEQFWRGQLWSGGCAVGTVGVVTSERIEQYINRV